MLKKIAIVIAVLIVAVLGYATTMPDNFKIERSTTINAPAETIFPHINTYKAWIAWSPFEKKDPAMKRDYSGAESGVGSKYAWDGNSDIGAGSMEITESVLNVKVVMAMHFLRPMDSKSTVTFTITPQADGSMVTWTMTGPNAFINKVMNVFINIDKMVGADFEAGLSDLKAIAEKQAADEKAKAAQEAPAPEAAPMEQK
ncbi:MAG: SRPBCC family protein [Rhodospirillaceae bacterium]|nr:SRPBCC family protein [Rhodospirillaceae bacterium]